MTKRTFTCWRCCRTFTTDQTGDEVLAEMRARFGHVPADEQESLCEACEAEYMDLLTSPGVGEGRP